MSDREALTELAEALVESSDTTSRRLGRTTYHKQLDPDGRAG